MPAYLDRRTVLRGLLGGAAVTVGLPGRLALRVHGPVPVEPGARVPGVHERVRARARPRTGCEALGEQAH